MHILIVKPSSLGDVIHTIPSISLLAEYLPQDTEFSWVVNNSFAEILRYFPTVKRLVKFPREAIRHHQWGPVRDFIRELRNCQYDYCLDYQGLLRSGLISKLSRCPVKYGFAKGREFSPWFYSKKILTPPDCLHAIRKNLFLTREFLRQEFQINAAEEPSSIPLVIPEQELVQARMLLPEGDGPILAVGFSSSWPSKNWSQDFFRDTIIHAFRLFPGLRCWLLGSPAEQAAGDALQSELARCGFPQVRNLAGKTKLPTLCCLLKQSDALLTNDSGPMHIAAILGLRCTALFGATNPDLTGPYGKNHCVIRSKCPDSPCFKRQCPHPERQCCQDLRSEDVAAALMRECSMG